MAEPDIFEGKCQQRGCNCDTETYCPLCQKFLCKAHDELTPRRMHDCLRGPGDDG